jgi:hypothetical protein
MLPWHQEALRGWRMAAFTLTAAHPPFPSSLPRCPPPDPGHPPLPAQKKTTRTTHTAYTHLAEAGAKTWKPAEATTTRLPPATNDPVLPTRPWRRLRPAVATRPARKRVRGTKAKSRSWSWRVWRR